MKKYFLTSIFIVFVYNIFAQTNNTIIKSLSLIFASDWNQILSGKNATDINSGINTGVGSVNCIEFHKTNDSIIYIGTPGSGLWKTINKGKTWFSLTSNTIINSVSDIEINPLNQNMIYISSGDRNLATSSGLGVFKSLDGGQTWEATGLQYFNFENKNVNCLLLNPNNPNIIFAATNYGILKSINAGVTWQLVLENYDIKDMEFKPNDFNTIYASSFDYNGGSKIFISKNGGNNFDISVPINFDFENITRIELAVCKTKPDFVYALTVDKNSNKINSLYISENAGVNWLLKNDLSLLLGKENYNFENKGIYNISMIVSPINANEIIIGSTNIWKSIDGGQNFVLNNNCTTQNDNWLHSNQHVLEFNILDSTLYIGNDGGIYSSQNFGNKWFYLGQELNISQILNFDVSRLVPNLILSTSQNNSAILYKNNNVYSIGYFDTWDCVTDYSNSEILYFTTTNGEVYKSENQGIAYTNISPDTTYNNKVAIKLNKNNPNIIYVASDKIFKSNDRGLEWTELNTSPWKSKIYELEFNAKNENSLYLTSESGIWKSSDAGKTWNDITNDLPTPIKKLQTNYSKYYDIEIDSDNSNILWLTISDYIENKKVYKSVDGGKTWLNISNNLPNIKINCILNQNGKYGNLFLGTEEGIYFLDKLTNLWTNCSLNLPNSKVTDLEIDYKNNKLMASTLGRGIWAINLFDNSNFLPYTDFSASMISPCLNEKVYLYDLTNYSPKTWNWTITPGSYEFVENTNKNSQNPVIKFNKSGVYSITLVTTNNNGSNTNIKSDLLLAGTPFSMFNYTVENKEISLINKSINAKSFEWDFNDGATSVEENPVHLYKNYGFYSVKLKTTNHCGTHETIKNLNLILDINQNHENPITYFPNPLKDKLNINNISTSDFYNLTIYELSGKQVFDQKIYLIQGLNSIELNLKTGLYLMKIENENFNVTDKILINN